METLDGVGILELDGDFCLATNTCSNWFDIECIVKIRDIDVIVILNDILEATPIGSILISRFSSFWHVECAIVLLLVREGVGADGRNRCSYVNRGYEGFCKSVILDGLDRVRYMNALEILAVAESIFANRGDCFSLEVDNEVRNFSARFIIPIIIYIPKISSKSKLVYIIFTSESVGSRGVFLFITKYSTMQT